MADLTKTVSIVFSGDDRITKTVDAINGSIDGLGQGVGNITGPLDTAATAIEQMEAGLAALAVGGMALAVSAAGQFSGSFAEISTLVSATDDELEQFRSSILAYAADSTKSIDDINAAVYAAISAGIDYKDALALVSQAEQLSVAGKAPLVDTTVLLVSTLNAYGVSMDKAAEFSDALFQTVKDGQTTLPELATGLAQVTGIASSAGVPIDTLLASLAALTAAGLPTSQAVTGIKGALSNIIKPSGEAGEAAAQLGLKFDASALKTRGFEGVLQDVYKATGGNVDQMAKLFGSVEGLNAAIVLGADSAGKFGTALGHMQDKAGSTEAAYGKMAENFDLANQRLANSFRIALIEGGTPLLDEYGELAAALGDVFKGLVVGIDAGAFDPVYDLLESFAADAVAFLQSVARNLPEALEGLDFSGFVRSLEGLGGALREAFEAVFGDMDLTTAEGLEEALQKIVNGLTLLNNVTAGIVEGWKPFLAMIGAALDSITGTDEATQKVAGNVLGFGQAINNVLGSVGAITGAIESLGSALYILSAVHLAKTLTGITGLAGAVPAATSALGALAAAAGAFGAGWGIGTLLREVVPGLDQFTQNMIGAVDETWKFVTGTQAASVDQKKLSEDMAKWGENVRARKAELESYPPKVETEIIISATGPDAEEIGKILGVVDTVADDWRRDPLVLAITVEEKPALEKLETFEKTLKPLKPLDLPIQAKVDDNETKIEIERIKNVADVARDALKFRAEVDIAQINAATKAIEASFDSLNTTINSTGELIGTLFGELAGDGVLFGDKNRLIVDQLALENQRREEALEAQKELTAAQIRLIEQRERVLKDGGATISIQADGLKPALEMIFYEVLEMVQVRATEEGAEFLLGI